MIPGRSSIRDANSDVEMTYWRSNPIIHSQTSQRMSEIPRTIGQMLTNISPSVRGYEKRVPEGKAVSRKGHKAFDAFNIERVKAA
jgi:hypothetical protein